MFSLKISTFVNSYLAVVSNQFDECTPPFKFYKPEILSMELILTKKQTCVLFFLTSLFFAGCKDELEDAKIEVNFSSGSISIDEPDTVQVSIALNKIADKTEYVTVSVSSTSAEFGVDYGIDNLLLLSGKFTIPVPKGSSSVSFSFISMADFENETSEEVSFTISDVSDGLISGNQNSMIVTIENIQNYQLDNRAIMFDGINDYIDLGNIYDDVTLPLTISAWIWLDPSAPNGPIPIFDSQDGLPSYNGFNLLTSNTSIIGVQYGDGIGENNSAFRRAKSAAFAPVTGRWVNFTAVMRGATDMSLYFNGVDVGGSYAGESNQPMYSNSATEVAKIGYLFQNGIIYRFKGKIDELKIWKRSLTEEEIQKVIFKKLDGNETGLIGYWDFDEAVGDVVIDSSIKHFNGTLKGNPTRVLSEVPVR